MATGTTDRHVDYTAMEHHQDVPDATDTGDPSRPQGGFWRPEERNRGANFMAIQIGDAPGDGPDTEPAAAPLAAPERGLED